MESKDGVDDVMVTCHVNRQRVRKGATNPCRSEADSKLRDFLIRQSLLELIPLFKKARGGGNEVIMTLLVVVVSSFDTDLIAAYSLSHYQQPRRHQHLATTSSNSLFTGITPHPAHAESDRRPGEKEGREAKKKQRGEKFKTPAKR